MSEISLELKNIKKSFQEGEDVLESICLTAKKENLSPCWGLPAVEKPPHCGSLQAWNSQIPARFFWMERM